MAISFDDSQRKFIESTAENIRLLAPAGSGKTLSLLERCRWLAEHKKVAEKPKFLILTFTTAARDELKYRLMQEFASIESLVEITTLNKWGQDYIKKINPKLDSRNALIKTKGEHQGVFYKLDVIWSKYSINMHYGEKGAELASKVTNLIEELKNLGFRHNSPNMLIDFDSHNRRLKADFELKPYCEREIDSNLMPFLVFGTRSDKERPSEFLNFWAEASEYLWKTGRITFNDQKYWALLKLEENNSYFQNNRRYQHILVDEFQDINPLDLFLIKTLVKLNHSTLTIIGDDDQAIFEWRGSTPIVILSPEKFFETKFETYLLKYNHRSPANLVRISQTLISKNKKRENKPVTPKRHNDAIIEYRPVYKSHDATLNDLVELARLAYQTRQSKSLAIVSRKRSQLLPIQILLTSKNIPYYAHEDLNILKSSAFTDFKNILIAIAQKTEWKSQQDIINYLQLCLDYVDEQKWHNKQEKEQLINFIVGKHPRTLAEALNYIREHSIPQNKYLTPLGKVFQSTTVFDAVIAIGELNGMEKHYGKSEDDIFFKDPPFPYLAEFSYRYGDNFKAFIEAVEDAMSNAVQNHDDDKFDKDLVTQPVHLMTAHRTKGKEFDTVALLDVNDGIWPLKGEDIECERRLFYVAITRPKNKLVLFSVQSIGSKIAKISPFVAEIGLNNLKKSSTPNAIPPTQPKQIPASKKEPVPTNLEDLIKFAMKMCEPDNQGWVNLSDLGNTLQAIDKNFTPKAHKYKNLLLLLEGHSKIIELSIPSRIEVRKARLVSKK